MEGNGLLNMFYLEIWPNNPPDFLQPFVRYSTCNTAASLLHLKTCSVLSYSASKWQHFVLFHV